MEPLVVQGFSELKARQELLLGDRRRPLRQAAEAAIQLYRAWGKPEKVIEWEQTLAGL